MASLTDTSGHVVVTSSEVAGRLIAAHEEERRRIARDLHDDISQRLALLAVELEQLAIDGCRDGACRQRCHDLSHAAGEIATDVHRISYNLHPAKLETLGLVPAITSLCQELRRHHGLVVRFTHVDVPQAIPADIALCLYRIVQEALSNVVKHSGALDADVHLSGKGQVLLLRVADAGHGFSLSTPGVTGVGLASMHERVTSLGGSLSVHAAPGRGTRIVAKVELGEGLEAVSE